MALLLYSDIEREGMIATSAAKVDGEPMRPRFYQHEGHYVVLDHNLPHVLDHDAREICKIKGYRLASPQECERYYCGKRGETAIHEASVQVAQEEHVVPTMPQVLTTATAPASRPRRKG